MVLTLFFPQKTEDHRDQVKALYKKTPSKDLDGLVSHLGLDCEAVEDPNGSEKRESP